MSGLKRSDRRKLLFRSAALLACFLWQAGFALWCAWNLYSMQPGGDWTAEDCKTSIMVSASIAVVTLLLIIVNIIRLHTPENAPYKVALRIVNESDDPPACVGNSWLMQQAWKNHVRTRRHMAGIGRAGKILMIFGLILWPLGLWQPLISLLASTCVSLGIGLLDNPLYKPKSG